MVGLNGFLLRTGYLKKRRRRDLKRCAKGIAIGRLRGCSEVVGKAAKVFKSEGFAVCARHPSKADEVVAQLFVVRCLNTM